MVLTLYFVVHDKCKRKVNMSRVCDFCGKRTAVGNTIETRGLPKYLGGNGTKITGKTKRKFKPNIQRMKAVVGGKVKRVKVCAACLRSGVIIKPLVLPKFQSAN